MTSRFTAVLAGATIAAASLGFAATAKATILDISAATSTGLNPVIFTFNPGEYAIKFAGIAGGGMYDGYNLNCGGGCPASGWTDSFDAIINGGGGPDPRISIYNLPRPNPPFSSPRRGFSP